jgi:hypothetical protein
MRAFNFLQKMEVLRMKITYVRAVCVLMLSACSNGMLKKEDISTTQTIEQFVETRFRPAELPTLPLIKQPPKPKLGPGEALHDAYFNEVNPYQLVVPVQNLKVFCEARGGQFSQIESSRTSAAQLASAGATKNDVFYGHRAAYSQLGFDQKLADLTAAYDAQYYQQLADAYYPQSARNALSGAQRAGAFGKFGCENAGKPIWAVAVEPVKYNPVRDPNNLLLTPSMTLYIKATTLAAPK